MEKRSPKLHRITRIDHPAGRTFGWYVRVQKDGYSVSKLFSDLTFGGKSKALAAATEFRDMLQRKRSLSKIGKKSKASGAKRGRPTKKTAAVKAVRATKKPTKKPAKKPAKKAARPARAAKKAGRKARR